MQTTAESVPRDESIGPFVRVFLASLSSHLAIFLFVHFPSFLRERGATEAVVGTAASVAAISAIATRPIVGRVMDARGRRIVLVVGGILHTVSSALYLTVPGPGLWLLAVRALHGIAGGFFFSAAFAIAADLAPDHVRTQRLAIFGISGILPMSLGALLGDVVLGVGGFDLLFAVAAVLAFVGLGFAATVPETVDPSADLGRGGVLAAFRAPGLVWLWVSGTLFAVAIASYFVFVKNFVVITRTGNVTTFFTTYAIVAIAVRLLFGSLPDRFGEQNVFPPALALLAGGLLALSQARGPVGLALAGLLCGLGHAFAFPSLLSLFVQRSAPEIRGSVVAAFTALMDLGIFLSGPLFGDLADRHGHRIVFALSAAIALLASLVFVLRARRAPDDVDARGPVD